MDEKVMNQLDVELAHAGEETTQSPKTLLLEKLRITPEKQLEPMEFLFRLFGKPCFPRGELVAITGKAKSGKTFVTSMLMACCIMQKVLALERNTNLTDETNGKTLKVLWYDTEQSDESTQDILKNRIMQMTDGSPGQLDVFNVRAVEWKQRRALLTEAVVRYGPDLVIVDGIRDLVNDINDGVLAQEVMEELLHLATLQNCCIVCVLHQNKGSEDHNLRGWIGTELMNKAFEVYACEKLMPQRVFKLEQTLTRKYDIEQTMYFEVNEQGLPQSSVGPTDGVEAGEKGSFPQLKDVYVLHDENGQWHVDVRRLFTDAIAGRQQVTGAELRSEVCGLSNIRSWKFYNSLLDQATNDGIIIKSFDHVGHVIYALKPCQPVQMKLYEDGEPF